MKILFVTVVIPHSKATTAGSLEIYNYIKGLSEKHQVDLVCAFTEGEEKYFLEMSKICKNVYFAKRSITFKEKLFQILSYLSNFCIGPLRHRLTILLANKLISKNNYDIVQVEFTEIGLHIKKNPNTKFVLDTIDVNLKPALRKFKRENNPIKKFLLWINIIFTKYYEFRVFKNFDIVLARSKYDLDIINNNYPNINATVLDHIVDNSILENSKATETIPNSILFTGAFHRELNKQSAKYLYYEIYPEIKKNIPDVKIVFAGANPDKEMLSWAERDKSVIITGFVDNLFEYYFKCSVFVAPMFIGGGVITKIIEAMYCGCPVVTSEIGNEGICAKDGESVLISKTSYDFVQKINMLLNDNELRIKIAENAKKFVYSKYSKEIVINKLEEIYFNLIKH